MSRRNRVAAVAQFVPIAGLGWLFAMSIAALLGGGHDAGYGLVIGLPIGMVLAGALVFSVGLWRGDRRAVRSGLLVSLAELGIAATIVYVQTTSQFPMEDLRAYGWALLMAALATVVMLGRR